MRVEEARQPYQIAAGSFLRRHWGGRFRPLSGLSSRRLQAAYHAERLSLIASKPMFRRIPVKGNAVFPYRYFIA